MSISEILERREEALRIIAEEKAVLKAMERDLIRQLVKAECFHCLKVDWSKVARQ